MARSKAGFLILTVVAFLLYAAGVSYAEGETGAGKEGLEFFDSVPDSALVVVAGRSVPECRQRIQAFVDMIEPGIYDPLTDPVSDYINDIGEGGGLNREAPIAFVLMADGGGNGEEEAGPPDISTVAVVPIADYELWRTSWGESIFKQADEAYEYVEGYSGDANYFLRKGGYIIFAGEPETLDLWAARLEAPLSQARRKAMKEALAESPVVVNVSMAAVNDALPDIPETVEEQIAGIMAMVMPGSRESASALGKIYGRVVGDFVNGVDELVLGLTPGEEGLAVSMALSTVEGTILGKIIGQQGPTDLSDIAALPAAATMIIAGGVKGDAVWDYVTGLQGELVRALAPADDAAAQEAGIVQAARELRDVGLGEQVAGGFLVSQAGPAYSVAAVYRVADGQKALDTVVRVMSDPKTNPLYLKTRVFSKIELGQAVVSDETVGGASVKVLTQQIDASQAGPAERGVLQRMFGDALITRMAAGRERLYATIGADPSLMADLLSPPAGGTVDVKKVAKTLSALGDAPAGVLMISLGDYVKWAFETAGGLMPGGAAPSFEVPNTSSYAGLGISCSGGKATVRAFVPAEEILAAKSVITQFENQQRRRYEEFEKGRETDEETLEQNNDEQGQGTNDTEDEDEGGETSDPES